MYYVPPSPSRKQCKQALMHAHLWHHDYGNKQQCNDESNNASYNVGGRINSGSDAKVWGTDQTGDKDGRQATVTAMKRADAMATRVAGEDGGDGEGGKRDGNGEKKGNCKEEGNGKRPWQQDNSDRDNNNHLNDNGNEYNNGNDNADNVDEDNDRDNSKDDSNKSAAATAGGGWQWWGRQRGQQWQWLGVHIFLLHLGCSLPQTAGSIDWLQLGMRLLHDMVGTIVVVICLKFCVEDDGGQFILHSVNNTVMQLYDAFLLDYDEENPMEGGYQWNMRDVLDDCNCSIKWCRRKNKQL